MKRPPKNVIKDIQTKNKQSTRSNYSFRLPDELMVKLERVCKDNDITMTSVIEELIRDFVSQN